MDDDGVKFSPPGITTQPLESGPVSCAPGVSFVNIHLGQNATIGHNPSFYCPFLGIDRKITNLLF
ncbi:MAG: hypothetical protein H6667_25595 [Ardenticatenaceae bacterium]|nr:hypothetical protein [Ardenticatenaceae bacterium]